MRTKVRALLGTFLFRGDDIYKKVKVLSGGEKSRLALCRLMLKPYNMLIMDEPTNHLDIDSKQVLKQALLGFKGTLLIVSHDRQFLQGMTDKLFEIQSGGLKVHYDDISTFLAQRSAENIAQFEQVEKASKKPKAVASQQTPNQRKQLEKELRSKNSQVKKLEDEISKLEALVERLNTESATLDFSDQDAVRLKFDEVNKAKEQLKQAEKNWEIAAGEVEEIERQLEI